MLNFTAGAAAIKSALRTAQVKKVATAHRLIDMAGLQPLIDEISSVVEIVYLEDVRQNLSLLDKAAAAIGQFLAGLVTSNPSPDAPAVILFTSGTKASRKRRPVASQSACECRAGVRVHLALYSSDIPAQSPACVPLLRADGRIADAAAAGTAGGVSSHAAAGRRKSMNRIRKHKATILVSTDTFITQYARVGEPGDLKSLRLTVCGAERLRDETRALLPQEARHRAVRGLRRDGDLARDRGEPAGRQSSGNGRTDDGGHEAAASIRSRAFPMRAVSS